MNPGGPEAMDRGVALVAGSGRLPLLVAASLRRRGLRCRILALRGFADRETRRRAEASVGLLEIERALAVLAAWGPAAVALVGAVQRPPLPAVLRALASPRQRREFADLLARGDDHLMRGVARLLEEHGHRVAGLGDLAPELLAGAGPRGAVAPSAEAARSIALGFDLLARLAPFDIGQGAVVAGGQILAVEGPEGTDRMLARLRPGLADRLFRRRRGRPPAVLVKTAKAGQDLRVDLPAIGPATVRRAARAGLAGIAVGAGRSLVIDEPAAIAAADRLGLFLVGVGPGDFGVEGP